MHPEQILLTSFAVLLVGAAVTAITASARRASGILAFVFMLLAGAGVVYTAVQALLHGPIETGVLFTVPAIGAGLTLHIDALGAIFMLVISFVGVWATLYSIDYMLHYKGEDLRRYYPFFLMFVLGMLGVVVVWDMFFFFVFWEFMTLASYVLVVFEKDNPVNLRAGLKYFIMTHVATAAMFVAAIILWRVGSGSFGFEGMRDGLAGLGGRPLQHLVLALFFLGFATKAGVFPFGDWLPDAHPAAPSGVSAMLSGVMIKMGVYGFLRVFVWMLPISHASLLWGGIIATAGAISLFVGSLTALAQDDVKRLLAFSSIGQIGYVLLAVGTGVAFLPVSPAVSGIAFIAGLYHLVNHANFKALLFLNAGSVLYRAGTRDLNRTGGLAKLMPVTAATALVGLLALAGIPPLNGFASKWLILQATLLGGVDIPMYVVYGVASLFISAVALAYVVKIFGTAFLGKLPEAMSRYGNAPVARAEVPATMRIAQSVLAAACVGLGLVPIAMSGLFYRVLQDLVGGGYWPQFSALVGAPLSLSRAFSTLTPNIGEGLAGAWSPIGILVAGLICVLIANRIYHLGRAPVRITETWYCGEEHTAREGHYWASSFYVPFKDFLRMRIGSRRTSGVYPHVPLPRLRDPAGLRRALDLDNRIYYPLVRWGESLLQRLRATHVGIPQVYVLWMVAGMVLAIVVLFWLSS